MTKLEAYCRQDAEITWDFMKFVLEQDYLAEYVEHGQGD